MNASKFQSNTVCQKKISMLFQFKLESIEDEDEDKNGSNLNWNSMDEMKLNIHEMKEEKNLSHDIIGSKISCQPAFHICTTINENIHST